MNKARFLALAFVCPVAVISIACGDDDPAPTAPVVAKAQGEISDGCSRESTTKGELVAQPVTVKNNERTYDLVVPLKQKMAEDAKTRVPVPLILAFHGATGSGTQLRKSFALEAQAKDDAIVAYPNGENGNWDLERDGDNNIDMLFFDAIVEQVGKRYCIDTKRIFATGFSAGAYFANQLGCHRGGKLRAIISHAGGGPSAESDNYDDNGELRCPQRSVGALIVHGVDDQQVKLEEGQKSRDHWRRVNACKTGGGAPIDPSPCVAYAACSTDRPVEYCELPGLGHALWDQAAKVTWQFISKQ